MPKKFKLSDAEKAKLTELLCNSRAGSNQWILAQILLLRNNDYNDDQVAEKLHITSQSVRYVLRKYRKMGIFHTFTSVVVEVAPAPEQLSHDASAIVVTGQADKSKKAEDSEYGDDSEDLGAAFSESATSAPSRSPNQDWSAPSTTYNQAPRPEPEPSVTSYSDNAFAAGAFTSGTSFAGEHKNGLGFLSPLVSGFKKIFKRNEGDSSAAFNPHAPLYKSAVSSHDFAQDFASGNEFDPNDNDYEPYSDEPYDSYAPDDSTAYGSNAQSFNSKPGHGFSVSDMLGLSDVKMPTPQIPDMKIPTPTMGSPMEDMWGRDISLESHSPQDYHSPRGPEPYQQSPETIDFAEDETADWPYRPAHDLAESKNFTADPAYAQDSLANKVMAARIFNPASPFSEQEPINGSISKIGLFKLRTGKYAVNLNDAELERLDYIVNHDDPNINEQLKLKSKILLLCAQGLTNNKIEQEFNLARGTVSRIKRKFLESGLDAVLDGPSSQFFPSKLYKEQVKQMIFELITSEPQAYGYRQAVWSSSMVQEYVWRHCEEIRMPDLLYAPSHFFLRLMQQIVDENPEQRFYVRLKTTKEKAEAKQLSTRDTVLDK